ncbi:MAG: GIY-YIG nuclease family protein [Chitinophagaceae bacterium]|nr:MAG: GIY-YIG nuclease family protein [Chitinophagaceae bacterium]
MNEHHYFVYIITNPNKKVLYTGVTNDLQTRLLEHYENRGNPKTFAGKYYCFMLMYYEVFENINDAIDREKEIKGWRREKKIALINTLNPEWKALNKFAGE